MNFRRPSGPLLLSCLISAIGCGPSSPDGADDGLAVEGADTGEEPGSTSGGGATSTSGSGGTSSGEPPACSDGGLDEGGDDAAAETGCDPSGSSTGEPPPQGSHCDLYYSEWACTGGEEFSSFACGSPQLCDTVVVELVPRSIDDVQVANPAALQCVLEALRDGTVATHRLSVADLVGTDEYRLESFGDGTVVVRRDLVNDKCLDHFETWAPLREAAYFNGCLVALDELDRLECAIEPAADACVEEPVVCP